VHRVGTSALPRHSIKRDRRRSRGRDTRVGRGCNVKRNRQRRTEGERRATLRRRGGDGDRGAREQKNRRFFVQVNISARGPCLTGNALLDPSCTTKGSCCYCCCCCCCCRCRCRRRCSRCSGSGCYRRETLRAVARSSLSGEKTTSFSAPPTAKALCRRGRNRWYDYCVFQPIPSRCFLCAVPSARSPSSVRDEEERLTCSCWSRNYNMRNRRCEDRNSHIRAIKEWWMHKMQNIIARTLLATEGK